MVSLAAGAVVLVPFPFSDLSRSKRRPAVILADAGRDDWVLCQITSNPYGDPHSIALSDTDFSTGSLRIASFARPARLFTANSSLIVAEAGMLRDETLDRVIDTVVDLLRRNRNM